MEEYEAAGRAAETVKGTRRELERWGSWLKNLRPRPALEEINADMLVRYLRGRGAYRAKATLQQPNRVGGKSQLPIDDLTPPPSTPNEAQPKVDA